MTTFTLTEDQFDWLSQLIDTAEETERLFAESGGEDADAVVSRTDALRKALRSESNQSVTTRNDAIAHAVGAPRERMNAREAFDRIGKLLAYEQELATEHNAYLDTPDRDALVTAWVALEGLIEAYDGNRLYDPDYSSGADDAASLYAILCNIGLVVP